MRSALIRYVARGYTQQRDSGDFAPWHAFEADNYGFRLRSGELVYKGTLKGIVLNHYQSQVI